jgi:hypothetical protein
MKMKAPKIDPPMDLASTALKMEEKVCKTDYDEYHLKLVSWKDALE